MTLPEETIFLLRDEAYLALCRENLNDALAGVAAHKQEVESTRPPFGILAVPGTRKTFESTMQAVLENENSLEGRRAKIDTLEHWLKSTLQTKLHYFLWEESPDYRYSTEVVSAIDAWERQVDPYGEQLLAFARELKNTAAAIGGPKQNSRAAFDARAAAMAELRLAAGRLDTASGKLEAAARALSQAIAGTIYAKVRVLVPPFADMTQWVDNLGPLSDAEAFATVQSEEAEVRSLLGKKLSPLHAKAEAARETVAEASRNYFENYWSQLREHALTYYVEDRDVDEVLNELTHRHVAATRQRGQQLISEKADPYFHEH
ncbi:MAG TPA: hypothetical protein VFB27_02525 [Opitutaceae bacterium]|nr:hypothetical protein [Opitutaceae bacterium]